MIKITKDATDAEWRELAHKIHNDFDNVELWNKALRLFNNRLNERYINPAEKIQQFGSLEGEGFAMTTILCSLIEMLETFYQGKCYKQGSSGNGFEYGDGHSKELYVSFLSGRLPFRNYFDEQLAKEFYFGVRCSLLHEAMTRDGWIIRTDTIELVKEEEEDDDKIKILNRDCFLEYIKCYIREYCKEVLLCEERKRAFIHKMNCICNNV